MWRALALIVTLALSSAVLAHEGVQNPAVMARMNAMERLAEAAKSLQAMIKGTASFDSATADAAAAALASDAAQITTFFADPEDDPKSEASPLIWQEFETFAAYATDLETAAQSARGVTTLEELNLAFQRIGKACSACHGRFEE